MNTRTWDPIIKLLEKGQFETVISEVDRRLALSPFDADALVLRSVAHHELQQRAEAEHDLWQALAVDPTAGGARAAIGDLFVRDLATAPPERDFRLDSGERQTATNLAGIRRDHRNRYEFAARWLRENARPAHDKTGLDVFCGNGYGSRILANSCGGRVVGIDGSAEAVALAERVYGGHRAVFRHAYFPFALAPQSVDFAVSFESIEHVDDSQGFLAAIDGAVRGPLLLSFPLESGLSFAVNADIFSSHFRHFTLAEISEMLAAHGRRITDVRGQKVYRLADRRLQELLPPEQMGLAPLCPDSQFAVVVAERI